jgi:hypothetical protein
MRTRKEIKCHVYSNFIKFIYDNNNSECIVKLVLVANLDKPA